MRSAIRYLTVVLSLLSLYAYSQQLVQGYTSRVDAKPYHRITHHTDGNTLVFGSFDHVNGEYVGRLAKLDANGKMVAGFKKVYTNDFISYVRVLSDGKILISGPFTTINGNPTKSLVRLNADGSVDPSFNSALQKVGRFELQQNGKIITISASEFVRLNTDGTRDGSFSMANYVYEYAAFAVAPDDHIYFSSGGTLHKLQPNGDDAAFHVGTGTNSNYIDAIMIQRDGKIIIGGSFESYNGVAAKSLVRLNTDGQVDPSFNVGTGPGGQVFVILERQNGNLLVGGQFPQFNNEQANLVELKPNGTLHKVVAIVSTNWITSIIEASDQKITIGGEFNSVNNIQRYWTARFNSDYTLNNSFVPHIAYTNSNGRLLDIRKNGAVITGGYAPEWLGIYNGQQSIRRSLVQINPLGGYDYSFSAKGITNITAMTLDAILVQHDDKVLVSGDVRGYDKPRLTRLNADGSLDNSFVIGTGPTHITPFGQAVRILCMKQRGDALYISGIITSFNGVAVSSMVSLNLDGSIRKTYQLPENTSIYDFDFQSDGKIIALGYIPSAGGSKRIIRINTDGTIDNTFTEPTSNSNFNDLQIDNNDNIYLCGQFTTINGALVKNITRLFPNGNLDTGFDTKTGFDREVRTLLLLPNGHLAVGGYFGSYRGQPARGFIILDPTGEKVASIDFGPNSNTLKMTHSNGALFLAGRFVREDNTDTYGNVKIALSPVTMPDAAPVNLKAGLQSAGVFKIQWEDQSANELAFILERASENTSQFVAIDTVGTNVTSVTDAGIQANTMYSYRVKAVNDAGSSAYSNIDSYVWMPAPTGQLNMSLAPLSGREIQLTWLGAVTDHLGFIIERSRESEGAYTPVDTVSTDIHSFTDIVADQGTYFYQVAAYNKVGKLYSNKLSTVISGLENEAVSISVYPVPARDFIFASIPHKRTTGSWQLLSMAGEHISLRCEAHDDGIVSIDVQSIAPGLYVLQYAEGGATWRKKIAKQ